MSETIPGTPAGAIPGAPGGADPLEMMRAYLQSQQQIGPTLPDQKQITQRAQSRVQPYQEKPTDYAAAAGGRKASLKDFSNSVQNVVGQITNQIQNRKQQEMQQDFDRFTQAVGGIDAAKNQISESIRAIQANPQDMEARQRLQRAQQALETNQQILNMDYNPHDPKGQKRMKMIQKGMGIDPKTQQTPEYQALVKSMQKSYGVSQDVAGLISRIPQTQQGQGIKPPTGGQVLKAETDQQKIQSQEAIARLKSADQRGMKDDQLAYMAERDGMIPTGRGPDGVMRYREMDEKERAKIPRLAAKDEYLKSLSDLARERRNAMMNPKDPTFQMNLMKAYAFSQEADARMKMANAAADRVLIAKMKGEGEPKQITDARKAINDLTKQISAHQLAMSQQNAGFFGSDKYDANRAQAALTSLQDRVKQNQALIDSYEEGKKHGAESVSDEEILQGLDQLK